MSLSEAQRRLITSPKPLRKGATGQERLIAHRNMKVRAQLLAAKDKQDMMGSVRG